MLNFLSSLEIYSHAFLPEAYPDDEEKTSLRKGKERCSYDPSPVHMANLADPTIPSHSHPIPLFQQRTKHPSPPRTKVPTYPEQTTTTKKERKRNNPDCPIVPTQPTLQTPSTLKTPFQPPILFPSLPPPSLPRAQVKVTDCLPAC